MASQTVTLAKSESCIAIATYDDVLLTSTSITLANLTGANTITFWITVAGVTQFKSVPPAATGVLTFTAPLPVTLVGGGILFTNFDNFGIGKGVDTSGF